MEIRKYQPQDETKLFKLLRDEGDEWYDYHGKENSEKYKKALDNSITYLAFEDDVLCGYVRCREDDGYGVYIYDLLVAQPFRGRSIGRKLMEQACADYPEQKIYVMSDVDEYYKKQGYRREGSIFEVKSR